MTFPKGYQRPRKMTKVKKYSDKLVRNILLGYFITGIVVIGSWAESGDLGLSHMMNDPEYAIYAYYILLALVGLFVVPLYLWIFHPRKKEPKNDHQPTNTVPILGVSKAERYVNINPKLRKLAMNLITMKRKNQKTLH